MRIQAELKELGEVSEEEHALAVGTIEEILKQQENLHEEPSSIEPQQESIKSSLATASIDKTIQLEHLPVEAMIQVLSQERPIVIATILKQLPSKLGQTLVQQLELQLAQTALDWIPKLDPNSSRVLDGVMAEFEFQVRQLGSKLESQHQGEEKVRELRAVLLTGKDSTASVRSENRGNSDLSEDTIFRSSSNTLSSTSPANRLATHQTGSTSLATTRPFVIQLNRKNTREQTLETLLKLDDLDLLRVLYHHTADEVKSFLAGSSKAMRMRVEKLTPSRAIKQLRSELTSTPIVDEKTWRELAERFNQTAIQLQSPEGTEEDVRKSA